MTLSASSNDNNNIIIKNTKNIIDDDDDDYDYYYYYYSRVIFYYYYYYVILAHHHTVNSELTHTLSAQWGHTFIHVRIDNTCRNKILAYDCFCTVRNCIIRQT